MKKIFIIVCCLSVISGCSKKISEEQREYNRLVDNLANSHENSSDIPFDITLETEVLVDEIRYTLAISNVKEKITDLKALAYHDYKTDDVFPSIGIFDSKVTLEPNGTSKGVILVGYMPYNEEKVNYKLYVSYKIDNEVYEVYWNSTK